MAMNRNALCPSDIPRSVRVSNQDFGWGDSNQNVWDRGFGCHSPSYVFLPGGQPHGWWQFKISKWINHRKWISIKNQKIDRHETSISEESLDKNFKTCYWKPPKTSIEISYLRLLFQFYKSSSPVAQAGGKGISALTKQKKIIHEDGNIFTVA